MIEELTEEKLIEYGFSDDTIKGLLKQGNSACAKLSKNLGHYYASPDEKKIYSGDDYFLKTGDYMMFPFDNFDMVPAYYELNLKVFLTKKKKQYGIGYNEANEIVYYKEEEIKGAKLITSHGAIFYTPAYVEISIRYIAWLTRKIEELNEDQSDQYIKPELLKLLRDIESRMQPTIQSFKESKIKCAAWVDLLFERKYFLDEFKKTRPSSCAKFAKERYKIEILDQIQAAKNNDRNSHKKQFAKFLN